MAKRKLTTPPSSHQLYYRRRVAELPPVVVQCANCGKAFQLRSRKLTTSGKPPKYGYCCSAACGGILGNKHKTGNHGLEPRLYAKMVVMQAVKRGELVRPETCERCGGRPGLNKRGQSQIHGHHHDYNKPLDVEWLCWQCHNQDDAHKRPRGSSHDRAKLTEAQIPKIRAMLRQGVSQRKIAEVFGVSSSTISLINTGRNWKHVKPQGGR